MVQKGGHHGDAKRKGEIKRQTTGQHLEREKIKGWKSQGHTNVEGKERRDAEKIQSHSVSCAIK